MREQHCPGFIYDHGLSNQLKCLPNGHWETENTNWYNETSGNIHEQHFYRVYHDVCIQQTDMEPQLRRVTHYIAAVGYSISLCFTVGAVLVFTSFRKLYCQRNFSHLFRFVSSAGRCAMFATSRNFNHNH